MDEAFKFAEGFGGTSTMTPGSGCARQPSISARGLRNPDYYPLHVSAVTIYLTRDKKLVVEIALAGFEEKDITVQFRGDHLSSRKGAAGAGE